MCDFEARKCAYRSPNVHGLEFLTLRKRGTNHGDRAPKLEIYARYDQYLDSDMSNWAASGLYSAPRNVSRATQRIGISRMYFLRVRR